MPGAAMGRALAPPPTRMRDRLPKRQMRRCDLGIGGFAPIANRWNRANAPRRVARTRSAAAMWRRIEAAKRLGHKTRRFAARIRRRRHGRERPDLAKSRELGAPR